MCANTTNKNMQEVSHTDTIHVSVKLCPTLDRPPICLNRSACYCDISLPDTTNSLSSSLGTCLNKQSNLPVPNSDVLWPAFTYIWQVGDTSPIQFSIVVSFARFEHTSRWQLNIILNTTNYIQFILVSVYYFQQLHDDPQEGDVQTETLWLGLQYHIESGQWVWTNGEIYAPGDFHNWATGQPDLVAGKPSLKILGNITIL